MDVEEYLRLKNDLESRQRDLAKAEGRLQEVMRQVKEKFDCESPDELESLIARYDAEIEKLEFRYTKAKDKWDQKYKDKLQES